MDSFSFGFKEQPILFLHWQPVTSRGRHVWEPSFPSNSATLSTLTTLICAIHRTGLKFGFHIEVFIRHNLRVKSKRVKVVLLHQSNVLLQFIFCLQPAPLHLPAVAGARGAAGAGGGDGGGTWGAGQDAGIAGAGGGGGREALVPGPDGGPPRMCMTYLMIVVVCEAQRWYGRSC